MIAILTPYRKQAMIPRGLSLYNTRGTVVFLYQPTVKQSCPFTATSNRLHLIYTMLFLVKMASGVKQISAL